jgi:hypothetical protein
MTPGALTLAWYDAEGWRALQSIADDGLCDVSHEDFAYVVSEAIAHYTQAGFTVTDDGLRSSHGGMVRASRSAHR